MKKIFYHYNSIVFVLFLYCINLTDALLHEEEKLFTEQKSKIYTRKRTELSIYQVNNEINTINIKKERSEIIYKEEYMAKYKAINRIFGSKRSNYFKIKKINNEKLNSINKIGMHVNEIEMTKEYKRKFLEQKLKKLKHEQEELRKKIKQERKRTNPLDIKHFYVKKSIDSKLKLTKG